MLIDSHEHEDIFARVPELADQTDPVLRRLDALLDDDVLYGTVRADLGRRVRTVLSSSSSAFPAFPCRTWSPRVRYAPKECIALAARGVAVLRRKPCTPTYMIRTMFPLTPSSAPLCPLPSQRDRWPTYGKYIGGHGDLIDDRGAVNSYSAVMHLSTRPIAGAWSIRER